MYMYRLIHAACVDMYMYRLVHAACVDMYMYVILCCLTTVQYEKITSHNCTAENQSGLHPHKLGVLIKCVSELPSIQAILLRGV